MKHTNHQTLYLLPFYSTSTRTGYVAIVDHHQLASIRQYRDIELNISLGPYDHIAVDVGPVQVYRTQQIVHPQLHRHLNERDQEHLTTAPAWVLPSGSIPSDYLHVPASEPQVTATLQLVRSASKTWLQLVDEGAGTTFAIRTADIEVQELPEPAPDTPQLLLVIYRPPFCSDGKNGVSDLLVLAIPVSELEQDIRVLVPAARDRAITLSSKIERAQKFWLSDILLGAETERFIREVKSEFQSDPSKQYIIRLVRSDCITRNPTTTSVTVTYRIPEDEDKAVPVSISAAGCIEVPLDISFTSLSSVGTG